MAGGRGKGNGCRDLFCGADGMIYVWSVILGMVLCTFIIVGITGRGRVDIGDVDGIGGGPWWAWLIGVVILLCIFVVIYMISIQYAEPAIMYKIARDDDAEAGMPLTKTEKPCASAT